MPIGLILVELISNCMKHAFKEKNTGYIIIEIYSDQQINYFVYSDDGEGYDFCQINQKPKEKPYIVVRDGEYLAKLPLDEIYYIESSGNYLHI